MPLLQFFRRLSTAANGASCDRHVGLRALVLASSFAYLLTGCGARDQLLDAAPPGGSGPTSGTTSSSTGDPPGDDGGTGGPCFGSTQVPYDPPLSSPCGCPEVEGFSIEGSCGTLTLPGPFILEEPYLATSCATSRPFGTANECKGYINVVVGACTEPGRAPCIAITYQEDPTAEAPTWGGIFVDGQGLTWQLTNVSTAEPIPWSANPASGTFSATAVRDGESLSLSGRFEVCIPEATTCPI